MNTIIDRLLKVDLDSDIKDNLQASFSTDINDRLDSVKVGIVTEFVAAQKVAAAAEQAATAEDQAVGTGQDVVDLGPDADPTMSDSSLKIGGSSRPAEGTGQGVVDPGTSAETTMVILRS